MAHTCQMTMPLAFSLRASLESPPCTLDLHPDCNAVSYLPGETRTTHRASRGKAHLIWDNRRSAGIKPGVTSPSSPRPCSRALWPSAPCAGRCEGGVAIALLICNRSAPAAFLAVGHIELSCGPAHTEGDTLGKRGDSLYSTPEFGSALCISDCRFQCRFMYLSK